VAYKEGLREKITELQVAKPVDATGTHYDLPEYPQASRKSMADYFVPEGPDIQDCQRNTGKTGLS
jgi:hypothetical protein